MLTIDDLQRRIDALNHITNPTLAQRKECARSTFVKRCGFGRAPEPALKGITDVMDTSAWPPLENPARGSALDMTEHMVHHWYDAACAEEKPGEERLHKLAGQCDAYLDCALIDGTVTKREIAFVINRHIVFFDDSTHENVDHQINFRNLFSMYGINFMVKGLSPMSKEDAKINFSKSTDNVYQKAKRRKDWESNLIKFEKACLDAVDETLRKGPVDCTTNKMLNYASMIAKQKFEKMHKAHDDTPDPIWDMVMEQDLNTKKPRDLRMRNAFESCKKELQEYYDAEKGSAEEKRKRNIVRSKLYALLSDTSLEEPIKNTKNASGNDDVSLSEMLDNAEESPEDALLKVESLVSLQRKLVAVIKQMHLLKEEESFLALYLETIKITDMTEENRVSAYLQLVNGTMDDSAALDAANDLIGRYQAMCKKEIARPNKKRKR